MRGGVPGESIAATGGDSHPRALPSPPPGGRGRGASRAWGSFVAPVFRAAGGDRGGRHARRRPPGSGQGGGAGKLRFPSIPGRDRSITPGVTLRPLRVALALSALAVSPAAADDGPDLDVRGLLDVVATGRGRAFDSNLFNLGDSNFDAYRLRLFVEGPVAPRLGVFTQILFADAAMPRAIGAYAMATPWPERDLHLTVGKIPWPIGIWAARSYSTENPLVGMPLMYQHHTTLRFDDLPPSAEALRARAGRGQYGVAYASSTPRRGLPVVYDLCWDVGVALLGSVRPLELAMAVTHGTPGRMNTVSDENKGKSFMGRVGLAPWPAVRLGVSASHGAYLPEALAPLLPPGRRITDYHQELVMADATIEVGPARVVAEGAVNVWETPTVGDLDLKSWYVETTLGLGAGWWAAGRWEEMQFGDIATSAGSHPWDHDVARLEAGLGHRPTRAVRLKAVYQRDFRYEGGPAGSDTVDFDLFAFQFAVAF